jgi:NIMA (never in mitosis gene a)-related kinase
MKANYKAIKLLGEGSFGKAYLATAENDDKKYVLKQIIMDGMTDQEKRDTFNEAKILKRLDHPNIIKFKEVFTQRKPNEALNIITEYADGGDLEQKIEAQNKKPFPETQILDYFTQICLALQHLHKKNIIHRDLKGGNVFLMQSGLVKLGDFGIAKGLKTSKDKAKTVVGTPYYLSPEIINSQPYDTKSDIWSLGVLLYQMMSFKMPFNAQSYPLLSIKINRGVYSPPPAVYSAELRDILKRCLTKEPEKRPTVNEILQLPIIKDRIKNFLNEVQYNQDLSKTMTKKYKDKKKGEKHHHHQKPDEEKKQKETKTTEEKKDEKQEEKKLVNDKNKLTKLFKNKEKKKDDTKLKSTVGNKSLNPSHDSSSNTNDNFKKTNFLSMKKEPNLQKDKVFKEDEIGKALKEKGCKDLIDEKNGNFDVNKMNEDQYNQLRLLNNLHNVANNQEQDSDSEMSVITSIDSMPSSKGFEDFNLDEVIKGIPEEKAEAPNKNVDNKEDKKEIEIIKKEIEKEIGNDLFKEVIGLLDKSADKTELKFDRDLIHKKITELTGKGFDKAKVEKAIEKIDEIFGILLNDNIN